MTDEATKTLARSLTDKEWDKHFRAQRIRKRYPGMVPTQQEARLYAYLQELADEYGEQLASGLDSDEMYQLGLTTGPALLGVLLPLGGAVIRTWKRE